MTWGLTVGILVVMALFAFFGWVIFKEALQHRFWRQKVEEGDLEMITQLIEGEVERWRTERPAKGTPASVWQGIQGVEIVSIAPDAIHVSSNAEAQFALAGGERRQVSSAVDEAKRITAKLAERLLYDIPHVRADHVQIDVYTTFHEPDGEATQRCILTVDVAREVAASVDWENDPPESIAELFGATYRLDGQGRPQPIEPPETVRVSANGSSGGAEPAA